MKLNVIGSSSKGNCYYLTADSGETLQIECGVKGASLSDNIVGCLITHEHRDHCANVANVSKMGVDIYATAGTIANLPDSDKLRNYHLKAISYDVPFHIESFHVRAIRVDHDAAEPCGFIIEHEECGRILFATDCATLWLPDITFDTVMIECNYVDTRLSNNLIDGVILPNMYERTLSTHMGFHQTRYIIEQLPDTPSQIILLHLSENNADEQAMTDGLQRLTGVPVMAARANMTTNLIKKFID